MSDREFVNLDSDGNRVESLLYRDLASWKNDITDRENTAIRVMTYNVHGFTDRNDSPTLDEILDVIKRVNPDLLVIEEFVLHGVKRQITYLQFKKFLTGLGFTTITTDRLHNNVTASKFNGDVSPTIEFGRDPIHRIWRFANIIWISAQDTGSSSDLLFIGTHLDVYDESGQTRLAEVEMILDAIEDRKVQSMLGKNRQLNVIVTGDFNCLRPNDYDDDEWNHICRVDRERGVDTWRMKSAKNRKIDAVDRLEKADLIDASVQLGNPIRASVWANRRVDYICGRNVHFLQASTVRNASSDHYPVYADFLLD
jgi:endonuclease/exonuclease/phosphatase family metal-dependent hydrolase